MAYKVRMGSDRVEVPTLTDASAVFRSWIEKFGFGASDLQKNDGLIYEGKRGFWGRTPTFRVSYNGRVWDMEGNPADGERAIGDVVVNCSGCGTAFVPVGANHTHDGRCPRCLPASTGVES